MRDDAQQPVNACIPVDPTAVGSHMITAIILTYNEAVHITACIESVAWADSVLVFDSSSTDETRTLAEKTGVAVITHPFVNYSVQRDAALRAASTEWVFFIDADERSSPEQAREIQSKLSDPTVNGYWVPRHNYIMGRLTRGAGWYPDHQLRVLRRSHARYDLSREVHELVILDGSAGYLNTPLVHYNYRDLHQFMQKQEKYTDFAARAMFLNGIRPKTQNYLLQPIRHFVWRFITLKGYRDGLHGFRLSVIMAWYELQKYVRLRRAWRTMRRSGRSE